MNLTMTGMPASGKSTIGVMLAKRLGMSFVDIDILIQEKTGKLLKELIVENGNDGFLKIEGDIAADLETVNSIIAPGGSICYEDWAMDHLKQIGKVVYLKISFEEMAKRIGNVVDRGVAIPEGYSLKDLYDERTVLYEKYADITIDENGKTAADIVNELCCWISEQNYN
ncbi:shikimate kinase [Oribacterium sp. WCC10]|uniref:shikimate kinase n=1 Tax=Oribacterium sp. WCC10 TaxID=1855343 RepID=UPI0008DFBD7D|nr:shikimate kinase [Oribacterium sp. WCC10]SFG35022.1 shikimate kinase [Oribacterium sp. WCC10]